MSSGGGARRHRAWAGGLLVLLTLGAAPRPPGAPPMKLSVLEGHFLHGLGAYDSTRAPSVYLLLSMRGQTCREIDASAVVDDGARRITLDVGEPTDRLCLRAEDRDTVATGHVELVVSAGTYELLVRRGRRQATHRLVVSPTVLRLEQGKGNVVALDTTSVARVRPKSFNVYCWSDAAPCAELLARLLDLPGLSAFSYTEGRTYDFARHFPAVAYRGVADYEAAQRAARAFICERSASGVRLAVQLIDWTGWRYTFGANDCDARG